MHPGNQRILGKDQIATRGRGQDRRIIGQAIGRFPPGCQRGKITGNKIKFT